MPRRPAVTAGDGGAAEPAPRTFMSATGAFWELSHVTPPTNIMLTNMDAFVTLLWNPRAARDDPRVLNFFRSNNGRSVMAAIVREFTANSRGRLDEVLNGIDNDVGQLLRRYANTVTRNRQLAPPPPPPSGTTGAEVVVFDPRSPASGSPSKPTAEAKGKKKGRAAPAEPETPPFDWQRVRQLPAELWATCTPEDRADVARHARAQLRDAYTQLEQGLAGMREPLNRADRGLNVDENGLEEINDDALANYTLAALRAMTESSALQAYEQRAATMRGEVRVADNTASTGFALLCAAESFGDPNYRTMDVLATPWRRDPTWQPGVGMQVLKLKQKEMYEAPAERLEEALQGKQFLQNLEALYEQFIDKTSEQQLDASLKTPKTDCERYRQVHMYRVLPLQAGAYAFAQARDAGELAPPLDGTDNLYQHLPPDVLNALCYAGAVDLVLPQSRTDSKSLAELTLADFYCCMPGTQWVARAAVILKHVWNGLQQQEAFFAQDAARYAAAPGYQTWRYRYPSSVLDDALDSREHPLNRRLQETLQQLERPKSYSLPLENVTYERIVEMQEEDNQCITCDPFNRKASRMNRVAPLRAWKLVATPSADTAFYYVRLPLLWVEPDARRRHEATFQRHFLFPVAGHVHETRAQAERALRACNDCDASVFFDARVRE
jgi:hypothetical protein